MGLALGAAMGLALGAAMGLVLGTAIALLFAEAAIPFAAVLCLISFGISGTEGWAASEQERSAYGVV
ncbi:hypothetical protein BJV78DRAFT_1247579, partial [Lactifluus subvellereus]